MASLFLEHRRRQPRFVHAQIHPHLSAANPLARRITLLDGAMMGTMIQRCKLTVEPYWGERLKAFHKDVKGSNEQPNLSTPA